MILALLLAQATAAPAVACARPDVDLPAPLAAWTQTARTLTTAGALTVAAVDPRAVMLVGVPKPTGPGRAVVVRFRVGTAATYGIALDQKGWIDLYPARSAAALASSAHGHGPACSTIRKIVRFALVPGEYRVRVSGLETPAAKLMLVRG